MEFYKIKNGKIHVIVSKYVDKYLCGQNFMHEDVSMSGYKVENLVRNLGPECLCKRCFAKIKQDPRFKKRTELILPDELFEI